MSLGVKTALVLSTVLAACGVAIAVGLSTQTRTHLVEGKVTASEMVVDLFAASVAPALDFDDDDGIRAEVAKVGSNGDVVYAAVYRPEASAPTAELVRAGEARPPRPTSQATVVRRDSIVVTRMLRGQDGKTLGSLLVKLSLARENARFAIARLRVIELTGLATLLTAAVILALARRAVTNPLRRLAGAAQRLEQGSAQTVQVRGNDEVGQLAAAFNAMSRAIVDREGRLAELNHELQRLLDTMRQAIVVFAEGGVLLAVRSRRAETLFAASRDADSILGLLYPNLTDDVRVRAFEQWLRVAFKVPPEAWDRVADLAPREVVLGSEGNEVYLSLDFRPIELDGRISRIMLLASDETEKRRLEERVQQQVEEHEKQMAAMRRLVAGGGQLLVSVLGRAHERVRACEELLAEAVGNVDAGFIEQLFQHVHSVKGEARAFDLSLLDAASSELEDYLAIERGRVREGQLRTIEDVRANLQRRFAETREAVSRASQMLVEASPIGAAILEQVTVQRKDVERLVRALDGRTDEVGDLVRRLASRPFGELLLGLAEAVPRWAARESKRARIDVEGKDVLVPPKVAGVLPDVLTHLVRNSLAHGIEGVADRAAAGKSEVGLIRLIARETPEGPEFAVEDDGRGLDVAAISESARALGIAAEDATRLVFAEGLSTSAGNSLSGRGVGLGAVKADLRSCGYEIRLHSAGSGLIATLSPARRPRASVAPAKLYNRTGST